MILCTEILPITEAEDAHDNGSMKIIALKYGESVFGEQYILKVEAKTDFYRFLLLSICYSLITRIF